MVGRPRSAECDRVILDAALSEYATRGLDGMSVDAVAARAGVSKATIYRRYPSKIELVLAAACAMAEEAAPRPHTGTLRGDLTATLQNLRRMLTDPVLGAAKVKLLTDALQSDELAQTHRELVQRRREHTLDVLRDAIARGELRPDVDLDYATDTLGAPLFYRYVLMHEIIDDAYIERVVDDFVARYGVAQEIGGLVQ
jgi:AcrR family transcriptional regulator